MIVRGYFFLLLALAGLSINLSALDQADSLQNIINQLSGSAKANELLELLELYLDNDLPHANILADSIIEWAEKNQQPEIRIKALFSKANALFLNDSLALFRNTIDQLEADATKARDKKILAQVLLLKGNAEWKKHEYAKALAIYNQLDEISKKNSYTDLQIEVLNQTGLVLRDLSQPEPSVKQFLKALELETKWPNPLLQSNTLNYLGSYYWRNGQYPKALEYYQQSLVIRLKLNKEREVINSLINIGIVYQDMGNYPLALASQNNALDRLKNKKDNQDKALVLNHIGNIYWRMGQYQTSLGYYQKSKQINEKLNDRANLANLNDNIGNVYKMTNLFDSALSYYNQSLQIRQLLNLKSKQAYSYTSIGSVYLKMAKYSDALEQYFKALALRVDLNEQDETAASYNNIAMIYRELSDFDKALEYHQLALEIYKRSGNKVQTAVTLNHIGNVYLNSNTLNLALDYHMQALRLRQESGDQPAVANSLNNIGLIYRNMKQFQKAVSFFEDAIDIYRKIGNRQQKAFTLNNLGDVYNRWENPLEALKYYQMALAIFNETNDMRGQAIASENIGQLEMALEQFGKAGVYLELAWKLAMKIKDGELIKNSAFDNYQLYSKMGNPVKALNFFTLYIESKDSIVNNSNERKMLEMRSRYELNVKEKEIELLKSKTELIGEKMQNQNRITLSLAVISVLLLLLCIQLYFSYRHKRAANKMFEKIFSIIAHDLRSPVAAMNNLSSLLNHNHVELTDTERKNLMEHIESLTQSLMGLLDNLLNWSRSRSGIIEYKPEKLQLSQLVDETLQLANPVAMNKHVTIEPGIDQSLNIYADKNGCLLILRNLIMNAIKFSNQVGTIKVFANVSDGMAIVGIQDNGVGIPADELSKIVSGLNAKSRPGTQKEKGFGMGLKLCNDFIKVNKGKLWAESIENEQTIFYFSLPLSPDT